MAFHLLRLSRVDANAERGQSIDCFNTQRPSTAAAESDNAVKRLFSRSSHSAPRALPLLFPNGCIRLHQSQGNGEVAGPRQLGRWIQIWTDLVRFCRT